MLLMMCLVVQIAYVVSDVIIIIVIIIIIFINMNIFVSIFIWSHATISFIVMV